MTVLDYRVLVESKRPRPAVRKNKTLAHKPYLLSISKLRNRVVLRRNSAIKKFKQQIKWYTIPPPGGGGGLDNKSKLRYRKGESTSPPTPLDKPEYCKKDPIYPD